MTSCLFLTLLVWCCKKEKEKEKGAWERQGAYTQTKSIHYRSEVPFGFSVCCSKMSWAILKPCINCFNILVILFYLYCKPPCIHLKVVSVQIHYLLPLQEMESQNWRKMTVKNMRSRPSVTYQVRNIASNKQANYTIGLLLIPYIVHHVN